MPNMKTLAQDDRAKMARAYIRGGMAPYQAARQTGFTRVTLMQEAIKAMEAREKDDPDAKKADEVTQETTTPEASAKNEPDQGAFYPFLPPGVRHEQKPDTASDHEQCVSQPSQGAYPFLPPGEKGEHAVRRPRFSLVTEDISVKSYDHGENPMIQITLASAADRYLRMTQQQMEQLIQLLNIAVGMIDMTKEDKNHACD